MFRHPEFETTCYIAKFLFQFFSLDTSRTASFRPVNPTSHTVHGLAVSLHNFSNTSSRPFFTGSVAA